LQLSDEVLARAECDDLEECTGILAVKCAHYRARFGDLPMSDTIDVLASETMNDEQVKWIGDGLEIMVGVLGMLVQEDAKQSKMQFHKKSFRDFADNGKTNRYSSVP
jgi:hypothetical protein